MGVRCNSMPIWRCAGCQRLVLFDRHPEVCDRCKEDLWRVYFTSAEQARTLTANDKRFLRTLRIKSDDDEDESIE